MRSNARTRVVIVGGGLGGLACAHRLAKRDGKLDVHLVDRKASHDFLPSLPWVIVQKRRRDDVSHPLERLARRGVRFTQAGVTGIDIDSGTVETTDGRIGYDELVLAPGATLAPESVAGLEQAAYGFYTLEQAERLAERLAAFDGGRVLIIVAAAPVRSLAAPYEAAFLINDLLRRRGVTGQVDVLTVEPRPIPLADPEMGDRITGLLTRRGIGFSPSRELLAVDPYAGEAVFAHGREPYDLLIAIPPHRAPDFVAESTLAGPEGWIRAAPFGFSAAAHVHAVGDVTEIELGGERTLPKAGVLAQAQGEVVADNIAAAAAGVRPRRRFRGRLDYSLEMGGGRALGARGDLYRRRGGGLRLRRVGRRRHREKVLFERRSLRRLR